VVLGKKRENYLYWLKSSNLT